MPLLFSRLMLSGRGEVRLGKRAHLKVYVYETPAAFPLFFTHFCCSSLWQDSKVFKKIILVITIDIFSFVFMNSRVAILICIFSTIKRPHLPSLGLMKVCLPSHSLKKSIHIVKNKIKTLLFVYS